MYKETAHISTYNGLRINLTLIHHIILKKLFQSEVF